MWKACIYLVGQSAPRKQCWLGRSCHPCWKPCTCQHGAVLDWRRRPPRGAPSPCAGPQAGSCPADVRSDADGWPRPNSGPFLAFVSAHPAAANCLCSHQHMQPNAGSMLPPVTKIWQCSVICRAQELLVKQKYSRQFPSKVAKLQVCKRNGLFVFHSRDMPLLSISPAVFRPLILIRYCTSLTFWAAILC